MFVDGIGIRRLRALVSGLPDDAAVWREERRQAQAWTQTDELLAQSIEIGSSWMNIVARLLNPKHPDRLPPPTEIERPEWLRRADEAPRVETDPAKIANWFRQHFHEGPN